MSATTPDTLIDHFLIAMPRLADPHFSRTVTYLCDHSDEGTMGLVINRPLTLRLGELLGQLELTSDDPALNAVPVYQGGPVQNERGFVLHQPLGEWEATLAVSGDIGVTLSRDILEAIARGHGPHHYLITLGYAGWGAQQLEGEMAANAWLNGPANASVLFEHPAEQRWDAAAALLGVDLSLLSNDIGHA